VLDQVRAAGLPVEFRTGGQPAALAPGVELTAYRIVQEALTNTLKHAPASQAVVTLAYEPDFVTITVANSAPPAAMLAAVPIPAPPAAPPAAVPSLAVAAPQSPVTRLLAAARPAGRAGNATRAGFGLAGIAERVASCGGNLSAGPAPDGGFAVTARLPAR
jgi:signal transduction histidine kinase